MQFFGTTFYQNTVDEWLIAAGVFTASWVILRIVKALLIKRLTTLVEKTNTEIDDLLLKLLRKITFFFLFGIAVFAGSLALTLPEKVTNIIHILVVLALLGQGAIWVSTFIEFWVEHIKKQKLESDPESVTTISALGFVGKLVLWTVLLLLALQNLGINVTGLVAGLGIGGIAIALAVQNVLGDLFASLSIVLDKPFVIGDFIIVDNYLGVVKKVGLKTTRIQSLSGEQLVFSNSDLLKSRIRNFKKMYERRVVFSFGVIYQTGYEKLEAIPGMVREIIEEQENTRFDRAHFKEYGDSSLVFEVVFYIASPDYNLYMDIQQAINLAIYRCFEETDIQFAYPTRTLYLQNGIAEKFEMAGHDSRGTH